MRRNLFIVQDDFLDGFRCHLDSSSIRIYFEGGNGNGLATPPPIADGSKNIIGGAPGSPSLVDTGAGALAGGAPTGGIPALSGGIIPPPIGGAGDADTLPLSFITSTYRPRAPRALGIRKELPMGGGAAAALGVAEGAEEAAGALRVGAGGAEAPGFFMAGGGGGKFSSSPSGLDLSTQRFFSASHTI